MITLLSHLHKKNVKLHYICLLSILSLMLSSSSLWAQSFTQHGPDEIYYANDLYIGKNNRIFLSSSGGLYKSDDMGSTWQKINSGFNNIYSEPLITANKKGDIYVWDRFAGIQYSQNNGDTWSPKFIFLPSDDNVFKSVGVYGDTLFIGTLKGLRFQYGTGTETFAIEALKDKEITSIKVREKLVIAGTKNHGLFVSEDGGKTFENRTQGFPSNFEVSSIQLSDNKLFIGSYWNGIYYSENLGKTWQQKNAGLNTLYIEDIYIDGNNIYTVTDSYKNIYKSTPDAVTGWQLLDTGIGNEYLPRCIVAKDNILIVGTWHAVFKSTTTGNDWTLSFKGVRDADISSLQLGNDSTIWAVSTNTGVYKKSKNESEFTAFRRIRGGAIGDILLENNQIYVLNNPIEVYDVQTGSLLSTFTYTNQFVLPRQLIHTTNRFLLSTALHGIWQYTQQEQWEEFNTGLLSKNVNDFKAKDTLLYAATDEGLFISGFKQAQWQKISIDDSNPGVKKLLIVDSVIIACAKTADNFISYNLGKTWQPIGHLQNKYIYNITQAKGIIYAVDFNKVHYSKDLGKTWESSSEIDPSAQMGYFLSSIVAVNDSVYLGTVENGILSLKLKQQVTGLEDDLFIKNNAYVYPNPSSGRIQIRGISDQERIILSILNQQGTRIQVMEGNFSEPIVDLSGLPNGLYFICILQGKKTQVLKVFKN